MSSPLQPLPDIDLRHLQRMTDDTGLFQHAIYATPDANHGYCIDDIARALIAGVLHAQLVRHDEKLIPLHTYLAFLAYAYNEDRGKFRNFMGYDRQWLEAEGSHDSQGRTIWALGVTATHGPTGPIRQLSNELYLKALPTLHGLNFPRSWAFALLGLQAYLHGKPEHAESRSLRDEYAEKLFAAYTGHAADDWPWWEDEVTYDNAKLCHALLLTGPAMGRPEVTDAGLTALRWLADQQLSTRDDGTTCLSIIGNDGWLQRGKPRAPFDQQPLEAYAMVDACLQAARAVEDTTQRTEWEAHARLCFEWFTGRNDLGTPLYDPETGGGRDGLNADGVNQNQGAESSLAYLLAVLEMHRYAAEA
ncbi:MAG: hypothetical protein AAF333_04495 [Planctomycetota bacterium]